MIDQVTSLWIIVGSIMIIGIVATLIAAIIFSNRRDITAREEHHQTILEKQEIEFHLSEARRVAVVGALAGGMAYYFNNTMFAIRSLLDMLTGDLKRRANIDHLAGLITTEVNRGLQVTEQLQHVAHPDNLRMSPISISEFILTITENLSIPSGREIEIVSEFDASNDTIAGDDNVIRQMLRNILINAVDAMPEGGKITLNSSTVPASEVANLPPQPEDAIMLRLAITDSGSGMSEETAKHIYEPFFTTKGQSDRLGLGLAFVYGIVRTHNGRVEITSDEGHGTTVVLHLPLATEQQLAKAEAVEEPVLLGVDSMTIEQQLSLMNEIAGRS